MKTRTFKIISVAFIVTCFFISCTRKKNKQTEEQIALGQTDSTEAGDTANFVAGNATMKQILTYPSKVILTGLNDHRLVSIYKSRKASSGSSIKKYSSYGSYNYDGSGYDSEEHFMPGIDILYGYNLLNIAHYDLKSEKMNYLFNHPVLIKTFYYPSFVQDSMNNQPINRNFYLLSVYDEDTNNDTLINKKDLRRFYHFDSTGTVRTQLVPPDYSAIRSQYDSGNDVMYIFAKHDENKNGTQDTTEEIHVFWFSLKTPDKAKLLY